MGASNNDPAQGLHTLRPKSGPAQKGAFDGAT